MTHKNNVCALDKQLITTVTTVVTTKEYLRNYCFKAVTILSVYLHPQKKVHTFHIVISVNDKILTDCTGYLIKTS